ncbi:Rhodanese-like domain [Carpediemonas membranifera]|uniref:Rhodanese-like domain n=1 Tax=Carpediemonas membranifera TaxID=201153 RepID=A0A8J6E1N1_9EUKA|nr:Rhodanese-like domain [Carpediemonas membranifera]|eukprot:KAG9393266.1 Rhodanese-like domain [Carpediemonas membranifera]
MKYTSIVTPEWVKRNLAVDKKLRLLDCSWNLKAMEPGFTQMAFARKHVAGAQLFDIDQVVEPGSDLPHQCPPADLFEQKVRSLGLNAGDRVICMDRDSLFGSPRVWWMFRRFGITDVSVMNGTLRDWIAIGGPTEIGGSKPVEPGNMSVLADNHWMRKNMTDVVHHLVAKGFLPRTLLSDLPAASEPRIQQIIDARSAERFAGVAKEPRPKVKSGHIPGSINIPHTEVLRDGRLKSMQEIWEIFQGSGVDLDSDITTSCGSGVTAATISLCLDVLGKKPEEHTLYDGSWSEYGLGSTVVGGKTVKLPIACSDATKCPSYN